MKLFHLGLCVGEHPKDSMRKAFLANVSDYKELSTGVQNVNQRAVDIVRQFRPDIVFMQIQAPNIITMQTVQEFKRCGAWVVNWNGDIRHETPDWMKQMATVCDRTLFTNQRDARNVRNGGYLEIGYDPEIYKPEGEKIPCRPIAFFGNNYGQAQFPLSGMRLEMNHALQQRFWRNYGVYGTNWPNASGNFNHSQYEEAKAYRSVKVAINLSHFDEEQYTSDRLYRIMGTGVFCLAREYAGMPFVSGKHLYTWRTIPELIRLIEYYMLHDEEREMIAKEGHEYVKENFTFDCMVKNLLNIYKQDKGIRV